MSTKKTPIKKTPAKTSVKKTPLKKTSAKPPVKKTTTKTTTKKRQTKSETSAAGETFAAFPSLPDMHMWILGDVPNLIPQISKIFQDIYIATDKTQQLLPGNANLTPLQRRRLFGVQSRKLGFITKALEIVAARPFFAPPHLSMPDLNRLAANLEEIRQLLALVNQLSRFLDDNLLVGNDTLYRGALAIYRQLQAQARMGVPGAQDLFNILRQFFILRRPRPGETQPTVHELERKLHSILHGTADGEIVVKNESPHMVGGVHEVVENVRTRGKRGAKIEVEE